jgi:hypothetical protein
MKQTAPIPIGSRRELFVDRYLIDRMENTRLTLHEPISGGKALVLDRPWEGPANGPVSVFWFEGRFLLYYRAMRMEPGDDNGLLCVAESKDGETWTKPSLGLVERKGTKDNNIVGDELGNPLAPAVWLDTRPGVPKSERIKAYAFESSTGKALNAFEWPNGQTRMVVWASADGFLFHKMERQPEAVCDFPNAFDGGNSIFWSEAEEQYVLYLRYWDEKGRTVARMTSKDFYHWTKAEPMTFEAYEQIYMNNTLPYYRAPHIYHAIASRFMAGRRVVTREQAEQAGVYSTRGHYYDGDCSDGILMTTRAGSTHYDRACKETFIRPGIGYGNWTSRTNYPYMGVVPVNDRQMMLFVNRNYMQDTWHAERLLLRIDGFTSVSAPWEGGRMVTKPLLFEGDKLEINFRTGAAGYVRVGLADETGAFYQGFALDDCLEIIGDEIERTVVFANGASVGALAGKPVRMVFDMREADVYSFRFAH